VLGALATIVNGHGGGRKPDGATARHVSVWHQTAGGFILATLKINGEAPDDTPLLWVIREELKLTGTKLGCGRGLCGACVVHIDGKRAFSCQTQVSNVAGKEVATIEGVSPDSSHPVQKAWLAERVPQCGYCQSGQIMSAADLLKRASDEPGSTQRQIRALQTWRLKRVVEYVENHLSERIGLSDLAAVAGLSRMHFARQFRTATGLRPHEFFLRRRIQRAEELLRNTRMPIVEIALTVGFQTQAHFNTVFKRFAGCTPGRWRAINLMPIAPQPERSKRAEIMNAVVD
jgi:isoquinoline 1-oxidoreductase subunit alpha